MLEALPALLAWNRWNAGLLEAFARATHPKAVTRLAWLADLTLMLERTTGFPGGVSSAEELTAYVTQAIWRGTRSEPS